MQQFISSHLVIVAVITVLADAQVILETLETLQNSFICGEQQVLKCTIELYSNILTWKEDTYPDPLASCSPFGCYVNPSKNASYNFIFDTDTGIFYMEILKVKVADNGTTYSCDNGVISASVTSNVYVGDDCSIVKDSKKIDSNRTEVSVTTGCIQDNAAYDAKFEWWLQEVNNTKSEKIKNNVSASDTDYGNSVCMADPDCGVSGYTFVTNSVIILDEGFGKNYSIGVDVTCGEGPINSVSFDLIFTLNSKEHLNPPSGNTTGTQTQHSANSYLFTILIVLGAVLKGLV